MARIYRIAISGRRELPGPTARLVDQALRAPLAEHAPGVTGLGRQGGHHTDYPGPQMYPPCTCDVPGPAASVGDLRRSAQTSALSPG